MDEKLIFASSTEVAERSRELEEFFRAVLNPDEQPLFISDEASLWDIFAGDPHQIIDGVSAHYGVRLSVNHFSLSLWKLIDFLSENRLSRP